MENDKDMDDANNIYMDKVNSKDRDNDKDTGYAKERDNYKDKEIYIRA